VENRRMREAHAAVFSALYLFQSHFGQCNKNEITIPATVPSTIARK
jgi:hypothetical protein